MFQIMRATKGALTLDALTAPYGLLRELEVYVHAEGIVEKRRAAQDRRASRRGAGRGRGRHR